MRIGAAVTVCVVAVSLTTSAHAASKSKKPNLAGLKSISGCVNSTYPPGCKKLGGYLLNDSASANGRVPASGHVTVWGKPGLALSWCWSPEFNVVAWKPNNKVCTQ
ncbi:MAG: hypothetical protein ABW198_00200 [Pseudorhodoplanes sp.]